MSVQQTLPLTGVVPDRTGNYRTDHLLVADMVERGSKVLDVGCGDGELLQLLVGGHMPRTENLPATWYDTPNIHFCTIKDFVQLCDEINVKMERAVALDLYGRPLRVNLPWWFWNMFGEQGVFLLSRAEKGK
jgi:hypothetical protein